MDNQILWPWGWQVDTDPIHELREHFNIPTEADRYLADKKTGTRYNHRIKLQHGDDELHVIFSYRNTADRIADYKKTRVILKGEQDQGFDLAEDWDGIKTVHGMVANTDAEYNTASKIADLLDIVTANNDTLHTHVIT